MVVGHAMTEGMETGSVSEFDDGDRLVEDLIAWLRNLLDQDEQAATPETVGASGSLDRLVLTCVGRSGTGDCANRWRLGSGFNPPPRDQWPRLEREHRLTHVTPEQRWTLAVVAAHRAILDGVDRYIHPHPGQACTKWDNFDSCSLHLARMATAATPYAARVLGVLYEDRDGYRDEWRPAA